MTERTAEFPVRHLRVRQDRRYVRTGFRSNRFLLIEVEAPPAPPRATGRRPVNLAFVLDRSGSMSGPKIETARQAVQDALGRLKADDRFSLVVYDDRIDVLAESTPATPEARRRALDQLNHVDARGSTNLGEGWLRGCEQVARSLVDGGINRCLLLTDGLANQGITDPSELERHARELRERGVATTTFGIGADFDERLLQAMADAGGGNFYFIQNTPQIADYMTSEVGESLEVVARDVAVQVDGAEGVMIEALTAPSGHSGALSGRVVLDLKDVVSEQRHSLVVRLSFPYGQAGAGSGASVSIRDREGVFAASGSAHETVRFEYADDRTNDFQPRDVEVDRAVARAFATRVRREALELNRSGRFTEAEARLRGVADRIRTYAGSDREMLAVIAELEAERPMMAAPMAPMAAKAHYFATETMARGRSPEGKAVRGPKS